MKRKRQVALLVISALLIGLLPMGNATVSKAMNTSASVATGTWAGYGLNNLRTDSDGVTTWDCVWFGNYWQEDTNGDIIVDKDDAKQPIKWRVLSVNGDDAFLLADKNLDVQAYNDTLARVTWETCTMRSWLNGYGEGANRDGKDYSGDNFFDNAFTSAEQSAVRTTNVVTDDSHFGSVGGADTSDKVYLLSLDEVTNPAYGFSSFSSDNSKNFSRGGKSTAYVRGQGLWEDREALEWDSDHVVVGEPWWLRSPGGSDNRDAAYVDYYGVASRVGWAVDHDIDCAVRPALHLNLSSTSSWSYAGTVTSEGGENGTVTVAPSAQPTLSWDIPTSTPDSNSGSMTLFKDCGGSTNSKGIADYLISDWEIKSPTFPVTLKKEPKDDGGYKIKATIGIGREDILDEDSMWDQYKNCVNKFKESSVKTSELTGFIETFGGKSGSFSVTEKMEAKPTLAFAGYYEIVCDKNNNIVSQEGGGTATASWSAKKSWQSVVMAGPVPIPLYFDLTGAIDLEGTLGISFASLDDRIVTGSLELNPSVALGGGLGVSGAVSVGVEGNLGLDAQLIPASKGSYNASLALKAYIAFVLDWTYQLPGAEMEGTIWDTTNRSRSFELFSDLENGTAGEEPSLSLVDRSYGEKTTEWYGSGKPQQKARSFRATDDYSSISVNSLQEYVMPNTIPLVQSVGGKTVMVFQSNDSGRNTADSSCLMYSVCEDGVWSQPKAVWDTGTCDLFADMKVIGGTLYLVWQKEKSEISGSTDVVDILDQMEKNSEICMAVFDAETGEFGQMQYITDDEETDMMPVLAESSSEVSVVWIQNTAGSFFGESGENRVMSVTKEEDSLTAPIQLGMTEDYYVSELAAAYTGGELKAAIVTTKITRSEDSESRAEASIPCVSVCTEYGQAILSSASEYAGSVRFLDGKLYYLQDTFIYEYDLQTGVETRISAGEVLSQENVGGEDGEATQTERTVFGSSYHIYRENGKTAIIWNEATDTGSVLKSSVKTENGFSAPVTIFETKDGKTIQNFDAILTADGDWQFAVNTRISAEDKSAIEYVSKETAPKLKVDYMMAEESERENGIQPVHISVTNESEETVTEYTIRIYTDEISYVEKTVECQILPGESVTFDEEVDLAELDGQADLNVQVVAGGQKEMDDTTASAPVGMTDLSLKLEKQVASDNRSVTFSALVKNESEVETAAHVALYKKETGEFIESQEVGVLAPGGQKTLDFVLSADDVAINGVDAKYYEAVAVSSKEEYNEENNTDYGVVYADEMKQDSPTALPSGTPEPTEKPGATPIAKPSVKPVTTPKPTEKPGVPPTEESTAKPTINPGTEKPGVTQTAKPATTPAPTNKPDAKPTEEPTAKPTASPGTEKPGATPTAKPSAKPTTTPGAVTPFVPASPSQTLAPVLPPQESPAVTGVGRVASIKLTQKKQTVTASWKKVPGAAGYQIWYSTSKKWKGKKQKLLRKNKVTVKNLKKKKTYYFRVRAYRLNGAKKVYGAWSKTKKITMKK